MNIRDLGTILAIWAHPDDETFTGGGVMAQAVANGQQVICVTATRGEKGIQDESRWPADKLGEIRTTELAKALEIIGVTEHHWLDCRDGECQSAPANEMITEIKRLIEQYKPDSILTFGPEGLTGHPDHQAVSGWVAAAAQGTGVKVYQAVQLRKTYEEMHEADQQFDIFFNIENPVLAEESDCDLVFELSAELQEKKYQALSSMPSQYEKMFSTMGHDNVCRMFCVEAFKLADL